MTEKTTDHQTARRRAVMWMFGILILGVVGLVGALIFAANNAHGGSNS